MGGPRAKLQKGVGWPFFKVDFFDLSNSVMPVIVPPVPTPATRKSILPSVSCQISSPVV
jgi:hypothetical protein